MATRNIQFADGTREESAPPGYRLKKARSSMFSIFDRPKPSSTPSEEQDIVVYDPLERKLWIDKKERVLETEKFVRVAIQGTDTRVQVYTEMGAGQKTTKVFIGSVDLGRLGKWVKRERKKSRMQYLYVLGQIPDGFGPMEEGKVSNPESE